MIGRPPSDSGAFQVRVTVVPVESLTLKSLGDDGTATSTKCHHLFLSFYVLKIVFLFHSSIYLKNQWLNSLLSLRIPSICVVRKALTNLPNSQKLVSLWKL